ncbi:MAG: helix-turn-helix transcriptional regulator [Stenotrophomonas acidaminiphila]
MSSNTNDTLMRQWAMLRLIPRAPRKISAQELQKQLAVQGFAASSRTVERDLQNLSDRFSLVADESSKPYGWSWARDANFEFTPRLSISQGVALLLSQAHLKKLLPQSLMKELTPLFDLAEKEVASTGWKDWHRRTAILPTSFPLLVPHVNAGVLDDVHHALAMKRCLTGHYRTKGHQAGKEMVIHPLGLLVRGSVQYLVCTLRDYKDIRHLALHRLAETTVQGAPCVPPEGFDFGSYVASQAAKYQAQGTIQLVARFTTEAASHLRDTPMSKDQTIIELDGGEWVEITATVEDDQTLRWWLLGFGERVEVLQPASLRDEMEQQLHTAVKRYATAWPGRGIYNGP